MDVYITVLATAATGITLSISTTIAAKVFPAVTAETKTADLRKVYAMVESRHNHFVEKILPRLPPSSAENPEFQEVGKTTFLLEKYGSRLNVIEGKIHTGGVYRWSPRYLDQEIKLLATQLSTLNENTLNTSAAADVWLDELLEDPEARSILYGEGKKDKKDGKGGSKSGALPIRVSFVTASQEGPRDM